MEIQKLFVSLLLDAAEYVGGLEDAQKEASSFRDRIGQTIGDGFKIAQAVAVAAAAAIGVAIIGIGAAAFIVSNDVATATANIQAELGTTAEEAERLGDIATDVWGNNFAGSITEAAGAVGLIRQQLGNLADDELQRATENAFRLQDVFGVEVPESVDAAKTLMDQFGLTSEEAFDFIAKGFQNGLNRSDDFLDTIGEYSVQFASGGADAAQFFSLLESGLQGGMLGTDKAADAFKEFRVRIQDGSDGVKGALENIGLDANAMYEQMADGSLTAADAFTIVTDALSGVDDENLRMQAGVALLGTQFEDLGTEGALALSLVGTELADMTGAVGSLDAKYNNLGSVVEGFRRRGLLALKPIGDVLLNLANSAMPLVDQAFAVFETAIAPAIETVATAVGNMLMQLQNGIDPVTAFVSLISQLIFAFGGTSEQVQAFNNFVWEAITAVQSFVEPIAAWIAENVELQDVLIAFGVLLASVIIPILASLVASILTIAAPVLAIIAVVALLRTAWEENWGGIQEKTAAVMQFIRNIITTVSRGIQAFWKAHGQTILTTAETVWQAIQTVVETVTSVISSIFAAFRSAFEGDWYGFGENLRAAAIEAWEFIKTTFSEAGAILLEWLGGFVLDILAKFNETDWGAVGRNIISGIANAIMNGVGVITDAARAAAQAALDAAKGLLGIESPSEVAAQQIGLPFNEGLAIGLGNVAPIRRSVADLVNELTLPFDEVQPGIGSESVVSPAPTPSAGGGSSTIINIDARGTDAPTVNRLRGIVREELAQSGRRADVRIRTG